MFVFSTFLIRRNSGLFIRSWRPLPCGCKCEETRALQLIPLNNWKDISKIYLSLIIRSNVNELMSKFWGALKLCENSLYETTANAMPSLGSTLTQNRVQVYISFWFLNLGIDNSDNHQFPQDMSFPSKSSKSNIKAQSQNVFVDNKYLHITFEFIEIIVWQFTDNGVLEKFGFKHRILQEKTHREWVSNPMSVWNAEH